MKKPEFMPEELAEEIEQALVKYMELTMEITAAMIMCTCAAHKQLRHYDHIKMDIMIEILDLATAEECQRVLTGKGEADKGFQMAVLRARETTIEHLKRHIPDFNPKD